MKKMIYDKNADALIIIVSDKKLGYEEEVDDLIVGFSEDNELIWLEILDVSKGFLPDVMNKIAESSAGESVAEAV